MCLGIAASGSAVIPAVALGFFGVAAAAGLTFYAMQQVRACLGLALGENLGLLGLGDGECA